MKDLCKAMAVATVIGQRRLLKLTKPEKYQRHNTHTLPNVPLLKRNTEAKHHISLRNTLFN